MKNTWRLAWPYMFLSCGFSKRKSKKTVNSIRLATMPTGHAQTRRRMPPMADARPNALPMTSRHRM
jgi:hypothetical protein